MNHVSTGFHQVDNSKGKTSKCMMSLGDHLAGKIPMPMLSSTKCTNIGNNLNIQGQACLGLNVMVQICLDILKVWKVMIILTPFIDRDAMMLSKKLHPVIRIELPSNRRNLFVKNWCALERIEGSHLSW